jgi:hypothetical protein
MVHGLARGGVIQSDANVSEVDYVLSKRRFNKDLNVLTRLYMCVETARNRTDTQTCLARHGMLRPACYLPPPKPSAVDIQVDRQTSIRFFVHELEIGISVDNHPEIAHIGGEAYYIMRHGISRANRNEICTSVVTASTNPEWYSFSHIKRI